MPTLIESEALIHALRIAALLVGLVALSWLCSFLVEPFGMWVTELSERLAAFRGRLLTTAVPALHQRLGGVWQRYSSEYQGGDLQPLVSLRASRLRRIRQAVETFGVRQLDRLTTLQGRLDGHIQDLSRLPPIPGPTVDVEAVTIAAGSDLSRGGQIVFLGLLLLLIVAAITINTFLLGIFFKDTLPATGRILWEEPVEIQVAHLMAFFFAILEIGTGLLFHYCEKRLTSESSTARAVRLVPWGMALGLLIIEIAAYTSLSSTINLAEKLGVSETSRWYDPVKYFLGILGFVIAGGLMGFGYAILMTFDDFIDRGRRISLITAFKHYARLFDRRRIAERFSADRTSFLAAMGEFREAMLAQFAASIGTTSDRQSALALLTRKLAEVEQAERDEQHAVAPVGELLGFLLLLAFSAILAFLCYLVFRTSIPGSEGGLVSVPGLFAFLLAVGLAIGGWIIKVAVVGSSYAPKLTAHTRDPLIRWILIALVGVLGLLPGIYLTVQSFVDSRTLGPSILTNVAGGIFLPALLLACSSLLDLHLQSAYTSVMIAAYTLAIGAVLALAAGAFAAEGLLHLARATLRLVAIPGFALRTRGRASAAKSV